MYKSTICKTINAQSTLQTSSEDNNKAFPLASSNMRSLIALIVLIACVALVHGGCLPNKYPCTRDHCYRDTYEEYPMERQNHVNYYMYNYVKPCPHEGRPYFGYPYSECSSCRSYQTEEVAVVKPDCPCQHH